MKTIIYSESDIVYEILTDTSWNGDGEHFDWEIVDQETYNNFMGSKRRILILE